MAEDRTPASTLVTAGGAPLDLRTIHHPDLTNFPEYSPPFEGARFRKKMTLTGERGKDFVERPKIKLQRRFYDSSY
jgi:hypothetical protein